MRRICYYQFGDSSVLQEEEAELPSPADKQVRIHISHSAINPIDVKTRAGLGFAAEQIGSSLPFCPGYDIAGTIEATGKGVSRFNIGDKVFGMIGFPLRGGAAAQYAIADESELELIPNNVAEAAAAATPLAGLTALQAIETLETLQSQGAIVAVLGAGGGVGHLVVQFLLARNLDVVAIASPRHREWLESSGASFIDCHDSGQTGHAGKYPYLIDCVGGEAGEQALQHVAPGGTVVTIPTLSAATICQQAERIGISARGVLVQPNPDMLRHIADMLGAAKLRPRVDQSFPLAELATAHARLESGLACGKIIIKHKD